jgi:hypothetical protein
MPKLVTEREDISVMESRGTDRETEVLVNRPDIVVKSKKGRTCLLIAVATP